MDFECTEYAFDYKNLKDNLNARIESSRIEVKFETEVKRIIDDENIAHVIVRTTFVLIVIIYLILHMEISIIYYPDQKIKKLDIK